MNFDSQPFQGLFFTPGAAYVSRTLIVLRPTSTLPPPTPGTPSVAPRNPMWGYPQPGALKKTGRWAEVTDCGHIGFSFRSLLPTEHLPEWLSLPKMMLRPTVGLEAIKEKTVWETLEPDTEKQIKLNIHDHLESFCLSLSPPEARQS